MHSFVKRRFSQIYEKTKVNITVYFSHILNQHELWNHKFEGNLFIQFFVCFCDALSHNTDLNVPQEKFSARPIAFQTHSSLFFHSTIEICVARNVCARVTYINQSISFKYCKEKSSVICHTVKTINIFTHMTDYSTCLQYSVGTFRQKTTHFIIRKISSIVILAVKLLALTNHIFFYLAGGTVKGRSLKTHQTFKLPRQVIDTHWLLLKLLRRIQDVTRALLQTSMEQTPPLRRFTQKVMLELLQKLVAETSNTGLRCNYILCMLPTYQVCHKKIHSRKSTVSVTTNNFIISLYNTFTKVTALYISF